MYLQFLTQCDLLTYVLDANDNFDVISWIFNDDKSFSVENFFDRVTACFKYPIFYYNLIAVLVKDFSWCDATEFVSGAVLGSILECNVRGIWSRITDSSVSLEFHIRNSVGDIIGKVDVYDELRKTGIEIIISDKPKENVYLTHLPSDFSKILFTKSKMWRSQKELAMPYPELVLYLSRMKSLWEV